ncbi:MAG: hypothetical protein HUU46_23595 [Candidatus Hydrogenedentes bacterium]|nr:hypothetical protein [Candidatus Hydrogenedentota bacterium]
MRAGSRIKSRCDAHAVAAFDYSALSDDFARLAKPAKRALIKNDVLTVRDLARRTVDEVAAFHGIGPSAIPVLREALQRSGLSFKKQ